jgi:hypothetical protein
MDTPGLREAGIAQRNVTWAFREERSRAMVSGGMAAQRDLVESLS